MVVGLLGLTTENKTWGKLLLTKLSFYNTKSSAQYVQNLMFTLKHIIGIYKYQVQSTKRNTILLVNYKLIINSFNLESDVRTQNDHVTSTK